MIITEMADAMLASCGILGVCFVVLLFADQLARVIRRF
jgi:hypothetical protein